MDFVAFYPDSLTCRSAEMWANLEPKYQIDRLRDLATMFEERVAQLDPNYRAFPWGLRDAQSLDAIQQTMSARTFAPLLPRPAYQPEQRLIEGGKDAPKGEV